MFAVIETGGKQYRVKQGSTIKVERLAAEIGDEIDIDRVLMLGEGDAVTVGKPYIEGAKVNALVTDQGRHKKINIIKFRRRKHYRRQMGHRQNFTRLEIKQISA